MAGSKQNGFWPAKMIGGTTGSAPVFRGYTTANEDISEGDVLYWSSGYLTKWAAVDGSAIAGVAGEDITGESGVNKEIAYYPAVPNVVYKTYGDGDVAATVVGENHDILPNASGSHGIDSDGTSQGGFKIIEVDTDEYLCHGIFDGDKSQFQGG